MSNFSSIISNYPIVQGIGQYLHLHHLYFCVLVSKEWNSNFIPLLWRNIDLMWNIDPVGILKHQHHIISLSSLQYLFKANFVFTHLPRLQYILKGEGVIVSQTETIIYLSQVLPVLNIQPHATILNTIYLTIEADTSQELIHALLLSLGRLPSLRVVELQFLAKCDLQILQSIISSTRQCTTFHLNIELDMENITSGKVRDFEKSLQGFPVLGYKDLRIRLLDLEDPGIIVPLLRHSTNIETFYLFQPYTLDTLQQISIILQHSPLKCFGIEGGDSRFCDPVYWLTIQTLLQPASTLQNIQSPTLHFKQFYDVLSHNPNFEPHKLLLNNLPRFPFIGLTSLDLLHIDIVTFVLLLNQLPSLRAVTASLLSRFEDFDMNELSNVQWPCLGIRKLDTILRSKRRIQRHEYKSHSLLFKNIGKLTSLQEWTFRCSQRILTESLVTKPDIRGNLQRGGYLKELVNLKQLYKMDLSYGPYNKESFDIEDITWMTNHWASLRHIIIPRHHIPIEARPSVINLAKKKDIFIDIINYTDYTDYT